MFFSEFLQVARTVNHCVKAFTKSHNYARLVDDELKGLLLY